MFLLIILGKLKSLKDLCLRYRDGKHYYETFEPCLELEADYDKKVKESQT